MKRAPMAHPVWADSPDLNLSLKEVAQMAVGVVIALVFAFLFLAVLFVGGAAGV